MLTGGRAGSRRSADPAYTPDIGHLVHRSEARAKSARARLAEVLSLTRTATKLRQVAHRKAERGGSERLQYAGMPATSRGGHVSVIHVRSTSEPWRQQPSRELSIGGSGDCSRELSPVSKGAKAKEKEKPKEPTKDSKDTKETKERWCDREVDGVFLGRSGWVQVQAPQGAGGPQAGTLHPNRPAPSQFHSPRSEPLPSPQRPGYLPLPASLDLGPVGTPPQTPIISPPPAFQDIKRSPRRTALARADAIVHESPPASPPPTQAGAPRLRVPARSVDEARRAFRESTSSSVSSFEQAWFPGGLRDAQRQMPRLSETDSSMGYDESDYTMINSPLMPQPQLSLVERVSPSRGRQRLRRSPGSEKNGHGSGSSSSSSSPSQHWRRVPVASTNPQQAQMQLGRAYADANRSYADNVRSYSENNRSYSTEVGRWTTAEPGSRASYAEQGSRASYAEQGSRASYAEQGSRGSYAEQGSRGSYAEQGSRGSYAEQGGRPGYADPAKLYAESRLAAAQAAAAAAAEKASRVRRSRSLQLPERRSPNPPNPSPQPPEYAESSRIMNGKRPPLYSRNAQSEELRRDAEEEARVVTEFLQSARSREAARNLIRSRLGATSDFSPSHPPPTDPYGVMMGAAGRRGRLTRMTTAPSSGGIQPCNPSSCDFWPHCAHRDGLYSGSRASTPVSQPHQSSMRLSHSYPNQNKKDPLKYGYSSRSSPASLERVDTSPRPRRGMSLNIPEPRYRRSPDRYDPEAAYRRESLHAEDWRHGRWAGDRPGSAPAAHQPPRIAESTQRSLSLPKCFQTGRELPRPPKIGGQSYQNLQQIAPPAEQMRPYLRREMSLQDPSAFHRQTSSSYPPSFRNLQQIAPPAEQMRRPYLRREMSLQDPSAFHRLASSSYPPEPSLRYLPPSFRQVHSFQELPSYHEQQYFPQASPDYVPTGRGLRRKMFTMNI